MGWIREMREDGTLATVESAVVRDDAMIVSEPRHEIRGGVRHATYNVITGRRAGRVYAAAVLSVLFWLSPRRTDVRITVEFGP